LQEGRLRDLLLPTCYAVQERAWLFSFSDHPVLVTMCRGSSALVTMYRGSSVVVTMCPGSSARVPFQDGSLKIHAMGEAALPERGVMLRCRRLSVPAQIAALS
jgi:hypothetical protein